MYLEGGGGGNGGESYELSGYFYGYHSKFTNCELSFFFITGDEPFLPSITNINFNRVFGMYSDILTADEFWTQVKKSL